ncbi:MAG: multiheme c-type cytochrome [Bacteroidales bacterium]
MKKFKLLSMLFSVAIVVSLIVISACTKEGPAGPAGKDGTNGEDGINGTDGTAVCGTCHDNSETVETKIGQWENSFHATSGLQFENRTTCAPCHTSQGFKEVVLTDSTATVALVEDPANINCYTCHKIHDTYTGADWALRKTEASPSWLAQNTFDFGIGNLCAQCHQPRISYQVPDVNNPLDSFTVTSTRFAPHYGGQSSTLTGTAYYLVGTGYNNSSHINIENTCVTCHMASAMGYDAGGHTFRIYNEAEGEINTAGCEPCHTADEAITNVEELQADVTLLLEELGTLLEAAGIYNPAGTGGYAVKGDYPNKVAGAYWNFISVKYDLSLGVHNPKFVEKVLENSIASLQ